MVYDQCRFIGADGNELVGSHRSPSSAFAIRVMAREGTLRILYENGDDVLAEWVR
jgi:hypothetical protein